MPTPHRLPHPVEPIDPSRDPGFGSPRTDAEDDAPDGAVWFRVGPIDGAGGEPACPDPERLTAAEVQSELSALDLEVRRVHAADDREHIVDRYERLLAERDRAIREAAGTPARGRLEELRARLGTFLEHLGR